MHQQNRQENKLKKTGCSLLHILVSFSHKSQAEYGRGLFSACKFCPASIFQSYFSREVDVLGHWALSKQCWPYLFQVRTNREGSTYQTSPTPRLLDGRSPPPSLYKINEWSDWKYPDCHFISIGCLEVSIYFSHSVLKAEKKINESPIYLNSMEGRIYSAG